MSLSEDIYGSGVNNNIVCPVNEEMDDRKKALFEQFEMKKKIRNIKVSTEDSEVKKQLRKLGEPICYFGEGPAERRERLKRFYALMDVEELIKVQKGSQVNASSTNNQTWFHNGTTDLLNCRKWLAKYSLRKAKSRNSRLKKFSATSDSEVSTILNQQRNVLSSLDLECSQIADSRTISSVQFCSTGDYIATSSWSGLCKIWNYPDCTEKTCLKGHRDRVGKIAFNPKFKSTGSHTELALASCDHSGVINLWNFESSDPISTLESHVPYRVSSVVFHPSSYYLASTCYDNSWRLTDLETNIELLHQEGHSREVHCADFHPDGSLICTGSFDSFSRLWDLRTGRCVMFMDGHLKSVLSVNFSPNGYILATGSADNMVKIWDIRQRKVIYTIPVHSSNVSNVKFYSNFGSYLITCSYDKTIKIWSGNNWICLKEIHGHEDRILDFDVSPDCKSIVSASFDRTFKVWKCFN